MLGAFFFSSGDQLEGPEGHKAIAIAYLRDCLELIVPALEDRARAVGAQVI
jgi:hypothetical protein